MYRAVRALLRARATPAVRSHERFGDREACRGEQTHRSALARRRDPPGPVLHLCDRVTQRRYRRAVGARGHFPTEQDALKTLYLVPRGMDPKGTGRARWTMRWKPALNAFAVTFADRIPAAENL